jgi:AraC-like DNA-binding protein
MERADFCEVKVLSMKKIDSGKLLCSPLLEALKVMHNWLERDGTDGLMVAAHTLKEFQRQPLPAHLRTSVKKRRSKGAAVKGPRHYRNASLIQTRWPEDGQLASSTPSLAFVFKGRMDMHIADYIVHCQPGDIIYFPPGVPKSDGTQPHYQPPYEHKSCDLFWMSPWMTNKEGMECWLCHSHGEEHLVGMNNEVCWIRNDLLTQQFYGLGEELQDVAGRKTAYHLLCCILLLAQREIEREHIFLPGHQSVLALETKISHDAIEEACVFIKSHLNQDLTIDRLARQVSVSPASFTRKFRHQTGKSFNEFVTEIRVGEAASLLRETQWSVNMVCRFIGLKPARLRQLFQQHHGCSPSAFRKLEN